MGQGGLAGRLPRAEMIRTLAVSGPVAVYVCDTASS